MSIGKPVSRIDGAAKVTGRAQYAADVPVEGVLHSVLVPANRPRARIARLVTGAAEKSPGVVRVFTHRNTPRFRPVKSAPLGQTLYPLQEANIAYEGQPIALVVADTLENAVEAARLVDADYHDARFETDFHERLGRGEPLDIWLGPVDQHTGDVPAALSAATYTVNGVYETADRHHNPMEPSATVAVWARGHLLVHDTTQSVTWTRDALAEALGLERDRVRVRCEFVGGGFGCKGYVYPHTLLAAMAARELERPVKLVLTRAQGFTSHGYQPASRQTIALAAARGGKLTGIRHSVVNAGSFVGEHNEPAGTGTRALYACPAIETSHRAVRVDRGNPAPMRAPLEGVGLVSLEIAMDELAYQLGMDPIDLRRKNHAEVTPVGRRPFSSKKLRECYARGAERFGWSRRDPRPRSMRDGRALVGQGMATALMQAFRSAATARATIDRSGRVLVETGTQELGGGTYTILAQIAADALRIPVEQVEVRIGDTALPAGPPSAGSRVTLSAGSAVQDAAQRLRQELGQLGAASPADYAAALARRDRPSLSAEGSFSPDRRFGEDAPVALYSFGAVFTEVRVDPDILIPRVTRVVGTYSAGRIINPKTAASQLTGGIVWGIGQALLEKSAMDHRLGRFLSKNLAGTLVPVNADVPPIDVSFIEEFDELAGPLGARGIGELSATGIGPAIANAVFHATGIRVRELPIRIETLLSTRPARP